MNPLSASLARSPELFPHTLEPAADSVTLLRLSEADYGKASFLDGRILGPGSLVRTLPFADVQAAVSQTALTESADFIFHIGHVGSTLLSRLLGSHPGVFSVREPAAFRTLAQMAHDSRWTGAAFEAHLSTLLKLWSRTFRPEQRALIKATSFASELAPAILARPSRPKAIFLFVSPANYLATILGAENSPQEARALGASRLARLNKRLGADLRIAADAMGELVAMSWACEMTALTAAPRERVQWLDFDDFLADPAAALAAYFRHLEITASPAQVQAIVSSPDMRSYSKAQEYDYDAKLRSDVLAQARARHGVEIQRGLDWLEKTAAKFPGVRAALAIDGMERVKGIEPSS